MKRILLISALAAASCGCAVTTSYSPPVGGMTISVPAGQTRSYSLPVPHFPTGAGNVYGTITAVGTNYIDDSAATWTAGAFSSAANPYYVRIKTGTAAGRVLMVPTTANTTTRMYLTTDGVDPALSGMAAGDTYELVLADTLLSLFGSSTLQGGTTAATSDNVQVWSGAAWLVFYYNTTNSRWQRDVDTGASPTRDNFVLRPDRGIMITRRAATALTMYVTGRVPEVAALHFQARPGVTFLSNGLPVNTTLGSLGLQNSQGWQTCAGYANSDSTADLVQVWSGAAWLIFYYDSVNGRWQRDIDATQTSRDTFSIPAGRPIMVRRLTAGATTPDGLLRISLPYTIAH